MPCKSLALLWGLVMSLYLAWLPANANEDQVDGQQPIFITLFLHEQLTPKELASLGPDYIEWFLKELSEVSGRRVHTIRVTQAPGITDFGYRIDDEVQAVNQLYQRVISYIHDNNLPLDTRRHKYLLVTRHKVTENVLGISLPQDSVAIASLRSYATIAHEIGHLFSASHENAETSFENGLPCRTLMYPTHSQLFANCYVFSEANRQAIRDYLTDEPGR